MCCVRFSSPGSWVKPVLYQILVHQFCASALSIGFCISQVLSQPEVGSSRVASIGLARLCCVRSLVLQLTRPGLFIHLVSARLWRKRHSISLEAKTWNGHSTTSVWFLLASASYKCSTSSKGREIVSTFDGRIFTKSDLENVSHLWSHQRLGVSIRLSISHGMGRWANIP